MFNQVHTPCFLFLTIFIIPLNADRKTKQIADSIQQLSISTTAAWRNIIDHCHESEIYIYKTHANSTEEDSSKQMDLAKPIATTYLNYVTNTFLTIQNRVKEVLGLALNKLETDLKPWTSKELLQSVVNNVKKVIEEISVILLKFCQRNQQQVAVIHSEAVRQLSSLHYRSSIFHGSQLCQSESNVIIDIATEEVQGLLLGNGKSLQRQFNGVVQQLLRYFRDVLQFASEHDDVIP